MLKENKKYYLKDNLKRVGCMIGLKSPSGPFWAQVLLNIYVYIYLSIHRFS